MSLKIVLVGRCHPALSGLALLPLESGSHPSGKGFPSLAKGVLIPW